MPGALLPLLLRVPVGTSGSVASGESPLLSPAAAPAAAAGAALVVTPAGGARRRARPGRPGDPMVVLYCLSAWQHLPVPACLCQQATRGPLALRLPVSVCHLSDSSASQPARRESDPCVHGPGSLLGFNASASAQAPQIQVWSTPRRKLKARASVTRPHCGRVTGLPLSGSATGQVRSGQVRSGQVRSGLFL